MELNDSVKQTQEVARKMPGKPWGSQQRFSDLVERLGTSQRDSSKRGLEN